MQEDKNKMNSLVLIDPHALTRISISHLLTELASRNRRSDDFLILSYSDPDEFVADYQKQPRKVGLIIFNIGMASVNEDAVYNGILQLKREIADVPLALLSDRVELADVLHAVQIGICGYISPSIDPAELIQSLRLVMAGGMFIPESIMLEITENVEAIIKQKRLKNTIFDPKILRLFTPRQIEVFQLLQQGKSNKIIAHELGMQESTVKVHVREIMTKLKATNRTHAVFLASSQVQAENG